MKLTTGIDYTNNFMRNLCVQISKAQKDSQVLSALFALLGSAHVKAARKMLVKSNLSLERRGSGRAEDGITKILALI